MEVTGILHCHSAYSYDAKASLSELKELFLKNGVQFVCMTEHVDELTSERAAEFVNECQELSDNTFLFIPGFEVPYKRAHILMIGMHEFLGNYAPTIESLIEWRKRASFVVLAHPVRNHFSVDSGLLEAIDALEVWNQQYEGKRVPRTRSLSLLRALRIRKPQLLATGGVDFHRKEHFGGPFTTLTVETLTEESILEKLSKGAFVVNSPQATFFGTLPNRNELVKKYWFNSLVSVSIVSVVKRVNKMLNALGISLPKSLKQIIRKKI